MQLEVQAQVLKQPSVPHTLQAKIGGLQGQLGRKGGSLNLKFFDFESFLGEVDRQSSSLGITVKDKPCLAFDERVALSELRLAAASVCDNGYAHLFYDLLHPTTVVHKALASAVAAELR